MFLWKYLYIWRNIQLINKINNGIAFEVRNTFNNLKCSISSAFACSFCSIWVNKYSENNIFFSKNDDLFISDRYFLYESDSPNILTKNINRARSDYTLVGEYLITIRLNSYLPTNADIISELRNNYKGNLNF